jgi:hypothetical protein
MSLNEAARQLGYLVNLTSQSQIKSFSSEVVNEPAWIDSLS